MLDREDWERLKEIHEQMKDLHEEAENLIRMSGDRHQLDRAKAYWLTYMENALEGPNFPLLSCTMGDTIKALEPDDEGEVEDDEENDSGNTGASGPDSGDSGASG